MRPVFRFICARIALFSSSGGDAIRPQVGLYCQRDTSTSGITEQLDGGQAKARNSKPKTGFGRLDDEPLETVSALRFEPGVGTQTKGNREI